MGGFSMPKKGKLVHSVADDHQTAPVVTPRGTSNSSKTAVRSGLLEVLSRTGEVVFQERSIVADGMLRVQPFEKESTSDREAVSSEALRPDEISQDESVTVGADTAEISVEVSDREMEEGVVVKGWHGKYLKPQRPAGTFVSKPQEETLSPKDRELFQAIENGNAEQVQGLLKEGANPNAVNEYGESALQLAVEKGSFEMVEALIQEGADVNKVATALEAQAPLLVAAEKGDEKIVELLLEAGADVDYKDEQGKTALHYTSNPQILNALLEQGADMMVEDLNGRAPLHDMAARGDFETIETALFYGADPLKTDVNGRTALAEAALNGHDQVYEMMVELLPEELQGERATDVLSVLNEAGTKVQEEQQTREEQIQLTSLTQNDGRMG